MAFTYLLNTNSGLVRLLIPDNNLSSYMFEDDEIEAFLTLEGGVKRAAAMALETIASNEALVLKAITLMDLSTDGPKVSDALLKRADLLRKQADLDGEIAGGGWDIAELVYDPFGYREILYSGYWP